MINQFCKDVIDGIQISWCKQVVEDDLGREKHEIKIHSIIDPERETSPIRISESGLEEIESEIPEYPEPKGLIVFGTHKHDRFSIEEVVEQYPEYEKALAELSRIIEVRSAAAALGSIRTEKKAASSRENGKKGGRPRKPQ